MNKYVFLLSLLITAVYGQNKYDKSKNKHALIRNVICRVKVFIDDIVYLQVHCS